MTHTFMTDTMEIEALNYLRDAMDAEPISIGMRLYQGNPGEDGTGGTQVVSLNGGSEIVIAWNAPVLSGTNYELRNSAIVDFGTADDDIGLIDYFGLHRTDGSNEMLFYGQISGLSNVLTGNPVSFAIGSVRVDLNEFWGQTAQQAILDWVRGQSITPPTALYHGFYTTNPNAGGGGVEVTTQITTARPAISFAAPTSTPPTHTITNTNKQDYGASDNTLAAIITGFGIFDAASAGNLLFWGTVPPEAQPVAEGDVVEVLIGDCNISAS